MPTTLCKILLAALFVVLLTASPGYAAGRDEANDLIGRANTLLTETRALEVQLEEQLKAVFAMDPFGDNSADALPMLADAQGMLGAMTERTQSVAALWAQVAALGVSEEATTYAEQQYKIAQTYLQYNSVSSDLFLKYAGLFDPKQRARMTRADMKKLDREIADLEAQNKDLYEQIIQMEQASLQYYKANDIGRDSGTGYSWISWIVGLTFDSVSALICGLVARRKNRRVIGWGVFGFFIPIPALIAILVVRRIDLEPQSAALLQPRF
jgi:hypothetical protein